MIDPLVDDPNYGNSDYLLQALNVEIFKALHKKYKDIEITPISNWGITPCGSCKYGTATIVIENPKNKKYFYISYVDQHGGFCKEGGWDVENCIGFFPMVGVHIDNFKYELNKNLTYIPNTIVPFYISGYRRIEELYNQQKTIPEKPIFRGTPYVFRQWIFENDKRFHFISTIHGGRIDGVSFIEELASSAINIDFNSVAEISCRTIESLGLKTALIRPKLTIQYHNPLIPDYHYAAVKCDDLSDYKMLANAYVDKFEELKKDQDLVEYLSSNGRRWYEENATIDSAVKVYLELIDLYKLFDSNDNV